MESEGGVRSQEETSHWLFNFNSANDSLAIQFMVLGNLIKMTISLYLDPGASNLFELDNRPKLKLKLKGGLFYGLN